jgi:hypothetical protein
MSGMARYNVPPVPGGWRGRETLRVVDPLGLSAAWIAPDHGGMPVGCYFRPAVGEPWLTAWETMAPETGAGVDAPGCHLLLGGPAVDPVAYRARRPSPWRFVARDPTAVTVTGNIDRKLVTITCTCEDGGLAMRLTPAASAHRIGSVRGFRLTLNGLASAGGCVASHQALLRIDIAGTQLELRCTASHNLACLALSSPAGHGAVVDFRTPVMATGDHAETGAADLEIAPDWARAG